MAPRTEYVKDLQYYKFCLYGFFKNQKFFEPFIVLFFLEKGLDWAQIGSLYSIRLFTRAVFEIPSGLIADGMGRRNTLLFSYGVYILSFLTYYVSPSFSWLIVPSFLFGLGDAFRTGTHKAMIFEYLKQKGWGDHKLEYYSHTRSWSQAGSALSSILAILIALFSRSYNLVFLLSALPYLIGILLLVSYPAYLNKNGQNKKKGTKELLLGSWFIFRKKETLFSIIGISSFSGYFQLLKDFIQPSLVGLSLAIPVLFSLNQYQHQTVVVGIAYFIIYSISSRATKRSKLVNDIIGKRSRSLNLLALFGCAAGILAGWFYSGELFLIATFMFLFIHVIENIRLPIGVTYLADIIDPKYHASFISIKSQSSSLIGALLAMVLGWLAKSYGLPIAIATVSAGALALSFTFILNKKA